MHTHEEMVATWQVTKSTALLERLLAQYDGLIRQRARKYTHPKLGLTRDDMYSEALYSFLESLPRFELEKGLRVSTFITSRIDGHLKHIIRDKAGLVKVPSHLQEKAGRGRKILSSLGYSPGTTYSDLPDAREFARKSGLPLKKCQMYIEAIMLNNRAYVSQEDSALTEDGESAYLTVPAKEPDLRYLEEYFTKGREIIKEVDRGTRPQHITRKYGLTAPRLKILLEYRQFFV